MCRIRNLFVYSDKSIAGKKSAVFLHTPGDICNGSNPGIYIIKYCLGALCALFYLRVSRNKFIIRKRTYRLSKILGNLSQTSCFRIILRKTHLVVWIRQLKSFLSKRLHSFQGKYLDSFLFIHYVIGIRLFRTVAVLNTFSFQIVFIVDNRKLIFEILDNLFAKVAALRGHFCHFIIGVPLNHTIKGNNAAQRTISA